MVDPFFTTGNNTDSNQWQNQWLDNSQQTINDLMSQQQQIQEKYKELKELLQDWWLTQNQKDEIHEQMQKLSDLYSQNKVTLASLTTNVAWEKEIHVNKDINTENSKAKSFSFKKFMIGCGILLLVFLGWVVVIFSSLMEDPNRLVWFWIEWCTAVRLLQIFSIVFFWILFFLWLALLLVNVNRLITVKNKRKAPYVLRVLLSIIILWVVWYFWIHMLQNLSNYSETCKDRWDTQLAHPHFIVKNNQYKDVELPKSERNKLIAPINVTFDINTTEYKNRVIKLWWAKIVNIALSCWNWERLSVKSDLSVEWKCFYINKWTYQPELIITYLDAALSEKEQRYMIWQDISIRSEIAVESSQQKIEVINSSFLVWKNPVTLNFDTLSIFKDFNLSEYNANWCAKCNCDWIRDKTRSANFNREYKDEWLLNVCVQFPDLSDSIIYTFPIRIEQWEVQDKFSVSYTVSTSNPSKTYNNPTSIEVTQLPTTLTLEILSINPDNDSVQRKLFKDWEQKASDFSNKNLFKVVIDEDKSQELVLQITNAEKQITNEFPINISVNRKNIVGVLKVSPDTVWTSPFEVTLDASTTSLTDPNDEIVWFSWDFWDWVKNKNTSTSIVTHEYAYDFTNENGVFYPIVTLQTKKWVIYTITGTIINVKKPDTTLEIYLEDNPAQLANVLQNVPMSITIDWMPTKISRDFWDWETLECDWRFCIDTSHVYAVEWSYTIKVKVEFEDKPTLDWKINLVVK